MARIRYIKPDFFKDEHLAQLPFDCRLTFAGLWVLADKSGILEDVPSKIKAELFSSDLSKLNQKVDIDRNLELLAQKPFIVRYEVDGKKYIKIIGFSKHQSVHHSEKSSTYPVFTGEIPVKRRRTPAYEGTEMGMDMGTETDMGTGMEKGIETERRVAKSKMATAAAKKPYWQNFSESGQDKIAEVYKAGFNIYGMLTALKTKAKEIIYLPESVVIKVCESYQKNKGTIKNEWTWFQQAVISEGRKQRINDTIAENNSYKREGAAPSVNFIVNDLAKKKAV